MTGLRGTNALSQLPLPGTVCATGVGAQLQGGASGSYARHAEVTVPSLADWEKDWEKNPQRNLPPKLLPVDFRSPLAATGQSN